MAEGRAERTIQDYTYYLSRFFKRYPDAFDPQKTRKCVLECMPDQMKPATYNLHLAYLRHALALSYLRNGGDTLSWQRIMGHTDLTMTKRYVTYTLGDIKEQHAMASPLNKFVPARKRVEKVG